MNGKRMMNVIVTCYASLTDYHHTSIIILNVRWYVWMVGSDLTQNIKICTVNLRVLVEKFTPRIVYVKSGVDFYAQTDIKRCRLEIGIPDVSYSQFPSVFQRSKLLQNPPSC